MKKFLIFLVVLLVAEAGIMGLFMYALHNENKQKSDEITTLKSQVDQLVKINEINRATIAELEEDEEVEKEKTENEGETTILTESEALETGKELYKKAGELYFGILEYDENDVVEKNGKPYAKINNLEEITELFSKNGLVQYLETNEKVIFVENDAYRILADRGADAYYLGNELKNVSIDENKIIFNSIEKYENSSEVTNPFIIVKEDGKWKVESYTLPY